MKHRSGWANFHSGGLFKQWAALITVAGLLIGCGDGPSGSDGMTEQAESAMGVVTGTVTYRERMALRLDAVITVRLQDVSLQDAPAMLLAEQVIEGQRRSVPIPFSIEYDKGRINSNRSYAVRADIRDGSGKMLWTTDTMIPVITRDAPTENVEVVLKLVEN